MGYRPIQDYGIVGDMQTAALVGLNGAIDWFCFPFFDSPSVFAAILDQRRGGSFIIHPVNGDGVTHKQFYMPDSNVLVTRFLSAAGVGELTDFMPVVPLDAPHQRCLVRILKAHGTMTFRVRCRPAFNFARDPHNVELLPDGACFRSPGLSLRLSTHVSLRQEDDGITGEFTLHPQETATFVLRAANESEGCAASLSDAQVEELFERTLDYWQRWIAQCTYRGRWREIVNRSALVLKLLTFEPTGAIVAAPTCSLPEEIGGVRNWDYRYAWIRDAAFTIYALIRIGFTGEAARFMSWLEARCKELEPDGSLQIVYGLRGEHSLPEQTLDHLEGYKQSQPVRIGNAAYQQLQLDIYGELLDSVYLFNKHGTPISYDLWLYLRRLVNWVCDNWRRKDHGIWEVRSGPQHFVFSKLMCWVAVDRGLRLADKRSFPADRARWIQVRDEIYEDMLANGWNSGRQAFVEHYASESLDAATLIMPLVFFMSPTDPRMLKTLDAINRPPGQGGLVSSSLVYRYNLAVSEDGLPGEEGTFNMCTFWLVEALTRAGRHDRAQLYAARLIFERMLGFANHLGLFSEQTGRSGEALGNMPQALTHLSLISAAFNLDRALGGGNRSE
ncbi:MAG: glycoside hydrolase family 15 protein [Bryobacteraceae bacterium]|nr:glycoside hydrolase family 15 protein [Bryobacteraceae bacterium]